MICAEVREKANASFRYGSKISVDSKRCAFTAHRWCQRSDSGEISDQTGIEIKRFTTMISRFYAMTILFLCSASLLKDVHQRDDEKIL